jgi:uncharacterized repeat protein (TIGR01451 family)
VQRVPHPAVSPVKGTEMRIKLIAAVAALAAFVPASPALAAGGTGTGADIQVSGSSNKGSPVQGQPYTYTYQVKNSGPQGDQGVVFTDDMPAGTGQLTAVSALWNGYIPNKCSISPDGNGGTLATCYLGLSPGDFVTVTLNVNAPQTIGTFANTGTATPSLTDPQPSNNSSTVNVKVGSAACPLPAGQPTTSGVVSGQTADSNGFINGFTLTATDGTQYKVVMNLTDATQPLTSTINLLCKVVNPQFYIQAGQTDNVTGPIDTSTGTPVIHAWVVQTPWWIDKVA